MAIAPRAQRGGTSAPGQSAPSLPANFGQGELSGEALDRLTGAVAGYVGQIRSRQDTIEAARIRQQFSEFSQAELVRLSSEQDFSREETFNAYKASLINRKRDLITNAPLTGNGRAKVDAELTNILGVGVAEAAQMRVAEQNRVVATALNQQMGEIMASISADPSAPLTDRLLQVDDLIRGYAPALTPEKEAALRTAATGQVVEAYMQPLIEAADTEGLRTMLDDPTVRNALGQEQYRTLSTQLRVQEVAKAQEAARRQAALDFLASQGYDVNNDRLKLMAAGFDPDKVMPRGPAPSAQDVEIQRRMQAGQSFEEAVMATYGDGSNGNTSTGGTFNERDRNALTGFGNAVIETAPGVPPAVTYTQMADAFSIIHERGLAGRDKVTGIMNPLTIPVSARQAIERAGVSVDEVIQDPAAAAVQAAINLGIPLPISMQPSRQPGALPPEQGGPSIPMIGATPPQEAAPSAAVSPEQVATEATFGPLATIQGDDTQRAQAIDALMQPSLDYLGSSGMDDAPPAPPFSMYGMADLIANPPERLMAIPGLFPNTTPTEKQAAIFSARENAKLSWFSLTEGLRTSPRFADAERQELQRLLSGIDPDRWFTNPGAFRADLTGVSEFLVRRYNHHKRILDREEKARKAGRSGQPAEQLRASATMLNAMEWAIETIGHQDVEGNVIEHPSIVPDAVIGETFTDADAQRMREIEDRLREMGVPVP